MRLPVREDFVATRNACKMCTPLGACLAFSGVEGCVPFLHGSQGCATYIRRYLISHFREPMDIASSNFGEHAAIFGGRDNLQLGLSNVIQAYGPRMVGVATTCLSETIGDDMPMLLGQFHREAMPGLVGEGPEPVLVHAATPSYVGTHAEGYREAVHAIVKTLARPGETRRGTVNLIPSIVSPEDLRYLREIAESFGLQPTITPDWSDRLDGGVWREYQRTPPGGTPLEAIAAMGSAEATLEMAAVAGGPGRSAAGGLEDHCDVPGSALPLPIGVRASDVWFDRLSEIAGRETPERHLAERGRLLDSYVDGHKYLSGKRVVIYGETDFVAALAGFATEIGLRPVLCASGGASGGGKGAESRRQFAEAIDAACRGEDPGREIMAGVDFEEIREAAADAAPDLLLGSSKGLCLSRDLGVPLVRAGLPVHDRIGAARMLHVGYRGAQQLFDRLVNTLLDAQQADHEVGFTYQ